MINICICEDNTAQVELVTKHVKNWASNKKINYRLKTYTSAEVFLFGSGDELPVDILLLDIQMGDMSGIDLAKTLRKQKNDVVIIFITGIEDNGTVMERGQASQIHNSI